MGASKSSAHPRICEHAQSNCSTEELKKRTHYAVYCMTIYTWILRERRRERENVDGGREREFLPPAR